MTKGYFDCWDKRFARTSYNITGVDFIITSTKLYVLLVTVSISNNNKLLKDLRQGLKRTIFWNKYKSEITTQPQKFRLGQP